MCEMEWLILLEDMKIDFILLIQASYDKNETAASQSQRVMLHNT